MSDERCIYCGEPATNWRRWAEGGDALCEECGPYADDLDLSPYL
jgi:formylmethanofuran dehydrogenase subunit E